MLNKNRNSTGQEKPINLHTLTIYFENFGGNKQAINNCIAIITLKITVIITISFWNEP